MASFSHRGQFSNEITSKFGYINIGDEIWLKNGLSLEDKNSFIAYVEACDIIKGLSVYEEKFFELFARVEAYEDATTQNKRESITKTFEEIDSAFQIGNSVSFYSEAEEERENEDYNDFKDFLDRVEEERQRENDHDYAEDLTDFINRAEEERYRLERDNAMSDNDSV